MFQADCDPRSHYHRNLQDCLGLPVLIHAEWGVIGHPTLRTRHRKGCLDVGVGTPGVNAGRR